MDRYVVQQSVSEIDEIVGPKSSSHLPGYHPTRWAMVNRVLDRVDVLTNGRADWALRVVSYLLFGGLAAIVNLCVFAVALLIIPLSWNAFDRTLIAGVVACEISLLANFIPNDRFTFRYMSGHQRSWGARCARFHVTSLTGSLLTILLQQVFSHVLHMMPLFSEALAIVLVLFYNFSFHHLFTYRHIAHSKN